MRFDDIGVVECIFPVWDSQRPESNEEVHITLGESVERRYTMWITYGKPMCIWRGVRH